MGFVEAGARFIEEILVMQSHAEIRVEDCRPAVDRDGLVQIVGGIFILLLLLEDVAKAPPRRIVSLVRPQSLLVAFLGLLKVLNLHILVTA